MPSNDLAISVRGLSKAYSIAQEQEQHVTLAEAALALLRRPLRRAKRETFWALKDISFDVKKGEVVGIIGRNGAGKSTLLKIMSRITEPTVGSIELYGRVGSLLEVGTGFHGDLSGRENIYLNGQILGMRRNEVLRHFDAIVAFAEVEKFIDTPVKRYSSGMYVRLAFAVAAHLNPEILIVDEVLAVGDAAFQKRCLGKMQQVAATEGRTVLFVSHNMAAVQSLCQRAMLLEQGAVSLIGTTQEALTRYLSANSRPIGSLRDRTDRSGSGLVKLVGCEVRDQAGNLLDSVTSGQTIELHIGFESVASCSRVVASVMFKTQMGTSVFLHHNRLTRVEFGELPRAGTLVLRIPRLPLPPSTYVLHLSIYRDADLLDLLDDAIEIAVVPGDYFGSAEVPPATHGLCLVEGDWRLA